MSAATPSAVERGRRAARDEGQWAVSGRMPLTAGEQAKQDDDGLHVRARIETRYAREGFDGIDPADLRQPVPLVGALHPATARASTAAAPARWSPRSSRTGTSCCGSAYRRRDARRSDQLRTIGEVADEFGRDVADVTDRQNVQYHWIRIEDVPRDLAPARGGRA